MAAAGSFLVGGTATTLLASNVHNFYPEAPQLSSGVALGAGALGGLAVVGVESYLYAYYAYVRNLVNGIATGAENAAVSVGQTVGVPVGNGVEKVEDFFGLNSDHLDLDEIVKKGTPDERALAQQIQQLMFSGAPTDAKTKQIQDLIAQLNKLLAADHDAPDHTDASFTTNNDNPPPPDVMGENPAFAPETQEKDEDPVMPKNSAFAPSTQQKKKSG